MGVGPARNGYAHLSVVDDTGLSCRWLFVEVEAPLQKNQKQTFSL